MQEMVAPRVMGHEIHTGLVRRIPSDRAGVDTLARPQRHEAVAGQVLSDGGDVAGARALARGRDRGVGGVAAMSLQIVDAAVRTWGQLVELKHGLPHAEQVGRHRAPPRTPLPPDGAGGSASVPGRRVGSEPAPDGSGRRSGAREPGASTRSAAAWIAARSPAAIRFSSTSAPPMPTKAAPASR